MAGDTSGVLQLATNGSTTALTIDTSQNVGIGTASPAYKLHVNGRISYNTAIGEGADTTLSSTGTTVQHALSSTWTAQNFFTGGTERMRITSAGDICINTTSPIGVGKLSISYPSATQRGLVISTDTTSLTAQVRFENLNGGVGEILTSGSNTTYATSSDYRLKDNIAPMVGALQTVAQLKPVTYKWKVDGSDGQGFIAHELQEVVPDCVNGEKDAVNEDGSIKAQGVDTSFLVATLTAAIQEQQTIINDLKARITALEGAA
jgi:hypothetical protein